MSKHPQNHGVDVQLHDVSHHYDLRDGKLHVLNNISLSAKPGEALALLGPSGSGKSTLLRLVAGLDQPETGTIKVGGKPVVGPDPERILAFQDATLFPWATVWDNVALGLRARDALKGREDKIDQVLDLVRLKPFAKLFPHQLSGGMAQRAALARALINEPRLLLLDEPFGKLDSLTRMGLQDEFLGLWQKSRFSYLLVTHDVEEAILLSDRVLVFSDRPARITREFAVDLPYPRRRDDPKVTRLRRDILVAIGHLPAPKSKAA